MFYPLDVCNDSVFFRPNANNQEQSFTLHVLKQKKSSRMVTEDWCTRKGDLPDACGRQQRSAGDVHK